MSVTLQNRSAGFSSRLRNGLIIDNLVILDTLRGFAAIYVLISHTRWLLWEGYAEGYKLHPEIYTLTDKVLMYFFSLFSFGHQAVIFFFVLSGFVIQWSVSKRIDREGKFDIPDYLYRRAKRIYPPLILAIVVTYVLDSVGIMNHLSIYFSKTPYSSINQNVQPVYNAATLWGNLFFLQRIYVPVWGTNGPLWSLSYEWWFYLLYIPLIFLFRKHKSATILTVLLLWIVNIYFNFQPLLIKIVLNSFISWFLGLLLADLLLYRKLPWISIGIFLTGIVVFNATINYNKGGADILLAIPITILLYIALTTNYLDVMKKWHRLGAFSYTLYVIHFPFICLFSGLLLHYNNNTLPHHSYYVIAGSLLMLPIAWILHFISEVPFTKNKKKLQTPQ